MRIVDTKEPRGSLRWFRETVNGRVGTLNQAIRYSAGFPETLGIEWFSPLESDEYAEYRDAEFLSLLGVQLEKRSLESFWPTRGPQWDGLAITEDGKVLLVEAKANIPEVISPGTGARAASLGLIEKSLGETKAYLGVDNNIHWVGKLYQYTNRLAHLYLLRVLNGIEAYMVFIYFTGAKDVNGPETEVEWKAALTVVKGVLGLGSRHKLSRFILDVFVKVPESGQQAGKLTPQSMAMPHP